MKVSFIGTIGGDGECFRWEGLSQTDKMEVIGKANYLQDRQLEAECLEDHDEKHIDYIMSNLYPGELVSALGCEPGKRYKFTLVVEELS